MRCAGCQRELEIGDEYIKFTLSEFAEAEGLPAVEGVDGVASELFGSGFGDYIVYCTDCTVEGGEWLRDTVYGDEEEQ